MTDDVEALVFAFCQRHHFVSGWAIEELAEEISKAVARRCAEMVDSNDADEYEWKAAANAIRMEFEC